MRLDLLFYHHPTARWVVIDLKLTELANPLAIGRYVVGARGVEPTDEPVDATGRLEEELASLAQVERQVTRFAARRAAELKEEGGGR